MLRLEQAPNSEYCDISTSRCDICTRETCILCNTGSDGPVVNINSDVFGKFILTGIMEDIKSSQQLLEGVCIELADHRQRLNDILSTLSMEVLNEGEVRLMVNFKNFIMLYTGYRGELGLFIN